MPQPPKRMRGAGLMAHHGAGERIAHIVSARGFDDGADGGVEAGVNRLVLGAGPGEREAVVLEAEAARGAVVRDGEERLQAGERALVDAVDQARQRAEQAAVGEEHHRQRRRERGGQRAFLDAEFVVEIVWIVDLDLAGDGGADLEFRHLRGMPDADRVDRAPWRHSQKQ